MLQSCVKTVAAASPEALMLQELQLADCSLSGAMFDCPSLRSLSLAYCPLTSIRCGNLPDLHHLDLKGTAWASVVQGMLCSMTSRTRAQT